MTKKIFITGATSGIGQLMVDQCLRNGYKVYATGRNEEALKQLENKGVIAHKADLINLDELKNVVAQLPEIDVVIINAGIGSFNDAFHLKDEEIDQMLALNIQVPIHLTKLLATKMIANQKGHFIFIGSQAGKVATKKASVYAASKHAITGFVNGLRMELKPYKIYVTGIYPGPIDTPFIQKADATNTYKKSVEKFLLKPEYVATRVVKTIEKPVREVNLPGIMGLTSKLYAMAPAWVEFLGASFFNKK